MSPSLRCPVMESWQLFHRYLETIHHLLKCGIVVYLVNLRHPFHTIPSGVCFVSQLERCCYVSFRELILSCSIFEKTDSSRVFPFFSLSFWLEFSEQDVRTKMRIKSTFLWSATWIMKFVLALCPSCLLTSRLESRDEILVYWGWVVTSLDLLCSGLVSLALHHV